jgi:hypothetical protein
MHPEIRKFWCDRGWEIVYFQDHRIFQARRQSIVDHDFAIWNVEIVAKFLALTTIKYYLDGKWYSQDEMLKIIKMKVFL